METEEYDAAEVSLQPGERIYGELSKDDQEIDVAIVNAGTEPCKPAEGGTVVELEYSADKDHQDPDFFCNAQWDQLCDVQRSFTKGAGRCRRI